MIFHRETNFMSTKVLTIGGACQDNFIDYKDRKSLTLNSNVKKEKFIIFDEGEKILVDQVFYSAGGGAVNSAFGFKKLDILNFEVTIASQVANDEPGKFVIQELKNNGIITNKIFINQDNQTARSFIIPSKNNNYTALCYQGVNKDYKTEHISNLIDNLDYHHLHITSLSGSSAKNLENNLKAIKNKNQKITISINPGIAQLQNQTSQIYNSLKYIDILILNAFEAQKFTEALINIDLIDNKFINPKINYPNNQKYKPEILEDFLNYKNRNLNIAYFFKEIIQAGAKIIVITNGKDGVYLTIENRLIFHPSIKTKIASTLGAGDSFASCFAGSLLAKIEIEKALIYGILNSTSVISNIGIKNGLLSLVELEEKFQKIKYSKLQKFNY